jgi:Dimerisation and cyclophilin-binding domain of Mon2
VSAAAAKHQDCVTSFDSLVACMPGRLQEVTWLRQSRATHVVKSCRNAAAALLEVLRQAIETRKTALVEVALDLIQRLIAHQALQVSVTVMPCIGCKASECSAYTLHF